MKKEDFLALGADSELAEKCAAAVRAEQEGLVPKAQMEELRAENKALKASISDRSKQLEALKQSGADAAALQEKISQLQAENAQKEKSHAAELRRLRVGHAAEAALREARAVNPATVTPLLASFLEQAELTEDGTVKGLSGEIEKLASAEGTAFLFRRGPDVPPISGAAPAGTVTLSPGAAGGDFAARLTSARSAGNAALAVSIKREAAQNGVQLF